MCASKANFRGQPSKEKNESSERERDTKERHAHAQLLLSPQCCRVAKSCPIARAREYAAATTAKKTCWFSLWLPLHGACDVIGQKVRHIWKLHTLQLARTTRALLFQHTRSGGCAALPTGSEHERVEQTAEQQKRASAARESARVRTQPNASRATAALHAAASLGTANFVRFSSSLAFDAFRRVRKKLKTESKKSTLPSTRAKAKHSHWQQSAHSCRSSRVECREWYKWKTPVLAWIQWTQANFLLQREIPN